ncbi:hypothetical protein [Paenibacillus sp. GYB003]|uniref:hypothetical protein n=1 Tax=Paenibacillus sp. GYB003 TaxID=2994392 RepID=UPI002F9675AE
MKRRIAACLLALLVGFTTGCTEKPNEAGETGEAGAGAAGADGRSEQVPPPAAGAPSGPDGGGSPEVAPGAESPGSSNPDPAGPYTITFEGDPRIRAPGRTLVPPSKQTFLVKFDEAMDRASVEQAIVSANAAIPGNANVSGKFKFAWASDRELRIELLLAAEDAVQPASRHYTVRLAGAKTKNGAEINEHVDFGVVVEAPGQLWRLSPDGKTAEKLTSLEVPYGMQPLGGDGRYWLLTRPTHYCECDAYSVPVYSLYDATANKIEHVPFRLYTNYIGEGTFTVDKRGFMYAGTDVPGISGSKDAYKVKLDGYVHGAEFSRDRKTVVAAVGPSERHVSDLDLVLYDLESGKERRFPKALTGRTGINMVNDSVPVPVSFYDDGRRIYTWMYKSDGFNEIRHQYDWKTGDIGTWDVPEGVGTWSWFTASADGAYRMYANGGLYKGDNKVSGDPAGLSGYPVHWLGDGHTFVYAGYEDPARGAVRHIYAFDADSGQSRKLYPNLTPQSGLLGTSSDGKWIYAVSADRLAAAR